MSRYKIFVAALFWLLSLAIVAVVASRIATRVAKEKYDPFTVEEIINFGGGWHYVTATQYLDGGSWDLGFQESNGYFIYVRIDYSLGVDHEYRKFYLRKNLRAGGDDFIEIVRGSDLERKVINLIEMSWDLNADDCKVLPERSVIVALMKSRNLEVIIQNPQLQ